MQKIDPKDLVLAAADGEDSASIRTRIIAAIDFQRERGQRYRNADFKSAELLAQLDSDDALSELLQKAFDRFNLSARGFYRLLKVARTIADLAQHEKIMKEDLLESMQFRMAV